MVSIVLVVAVLLAAFIFFLLQGRAKNGGSNGGKQGIELKAKLAVTANEQAMYWRLCDDFPHPEYIVMPQVAFSALLSSRKAADRNRYNRKRADFVICNKSFKTLAIVELDDATHKGNENEDAGRDGYLEKAGYKVLRYKGVPNRGVVANDALNRNSNSLGRSRS